MKNKKTAIRPPNKKQQAKSLKTLHNKTWNIYSKCRRKAAADFRGYANCFTCGVKKPWQELHLGHYRHRTMDFEPINTHPQCAKCNTYQHGRLDLYTLRLIDKYGREVVDDLIKRSHTHPGYSYSELKEIHAKYLKLFEIL